MAAGRSIAVIGAGWAGLTAAVECTGRGQRVTLYEMAPQAGGRARDIAGEGGALDNGQHICIGAYTETLRLLAAVGVDGGAAFLRLPLTLVGADGRGLRLGPGRPAPAFARAVLGRGGWPLADRLRLLATAAGWWWHGFRCDPQWTVARLAASLPDIVRRELVEPLCVAALNTPAGAASATVFLRVLKDALGTGPGSSDLLLPRLGLGALLPAPAVAALRTAGADIRLGHRVDAIVREGSGWRVDGVSFDGVVMAASAVEAARLAAPHNPAWSARAAALRYEPIVTVYMQAPGVRLAEPMLALRSDERRPAQFVFDRGRLGGAQGLLAFVASGAALWVERGLAAVEEATLAQAREVLASGHLAGSMRILRTIVEKRATFACTPLLERPAAAIAPGLVAAGDFVEGPYPATLEGAVRSGVEAARSMLAA
ncbi:MAG: hydroxysqualene dehydroxylase HpnE [Caldimonas sp.]